VEPLLDYYQALGMRLPDQMKPSSLLEYIRSTVIERQVDRIESYVQGFHDDMHITFIPAMNVCINPGNEQIHETVLKCHSGATVVGLYAKLLYYLPDVSFSKLENG
jgi:hypothetical protein